MKSLLTERIAARKIGSAIKQRSVQQEYNETTEAAEKLGAAINKEQYNKNILKHQGQPIKYKKL
jgi:hypothetical protein